MKAAVVLFPGSNADAEMVHTLRNVLKIPTEVVWYGDAALPPEIDLVALPGGFSFGDYLRCGAMAAVSPIVGAVKAYAERGGHVLGVCNGFQILTECGLLPGALLRNAHLRFECRDIWVRVESEGPFTTAAGSTMRLPIAHAEGRYHIDAAGKKQLEDQDRIALKYCDQSGASTEAVNPNGSVDNIAGVYGGPKRNVLGLMPHPERMSEAIHGGTDGLRIFKTMVARVAAGAA